MAVLDILTDYSEAAIVVLPVTCAPHVSAHIQAIDVIETMTRRLYVRLWSVFHVLVVWEPGKIFLYPDHTLHPTPDLGGILSPDPQVSGRRHTLLHIPGPERPTDLDTAALCRSLMQALQHAFGPESSQRPAAMRALLQARAALSGIGYGQMRWRRGEQCVLEYLPPPSGAPWSRVRTGMEPEPLSVGLFGRSRKIPNLSGFFDGVLMSPWHTGALHASGSFGHWVCSPSRTLDIEGVLHAPLPVSAHARLRWAIDFQTVVAPFCTAAVSAMAAYGIDVAPWFGGDVVRTLSHTLMTKTAGTTIFRP